MFPPEALQDGEVLSDVLEPLEEVIPLLDFLEELDGLLFPEIFGDDATAFAGKEVIVIAVAEAAFLDAAARDLGKTFLDPGFHVEVMGLGVLEDVDQNLHGDSVRNKL
jgi:hypothetical protein